MGFFKKLFQAISRPAKTGGIRGWFKRRREEKKRKAFEEEFAENMKRYQEIQRQKEEAARQAEELRRMEEEAQRDIELQAKRDEMYAAYEQYKDSLGWKEYDADLVETAFDTYKDRYDWEDMTPDDYFKMLDVWGGIASDMKQAFGGSDPKKNKASSLAFAYHNLNDSNRNNFPTLLKYTMNNLPSGANQETAINRLYNNIDAVNSGRLKFV